MVIYTQSSDTMLSVDAPPFHPSGSWYDPAYSEYICIYNDGEPTMTLATEKAYYDILHGIADEALDEAFPPDAEEAFELESTEAFVREMATLSILEEREEHARRTFGHLEKRWEVRRAAGPSGRPRPAMHLIVPVNHNVKMYRPVTTTLSVYRINNHRLATEQYERAKMAKRVDRRRNKTVAPPPRPIVQPRKNS